MTVLAAAIGLAVGTVVGALGGGGGIMTVPILVYLLDVPAHAAATGSLVIVGATSLVATVAHARRHAVAWGPGAVFGVLGSVLAYVGARLSVSVRPDVLMAAFAGLLCVVAVLMLRRSWTAARRAGARSAEGSHAPAGRDGGGRVDLGSPRRALAVVLAAAVTGLLTGFFGVGGGFAVVPALVLGLRLDMRRAVGTSLFVIVLNSITGLAGRTGELASVPWALVVAFAAASMVGGLVGARVSRHAPADRLSLAFGVLLAVVAVLTAVQAVPDLL